MQRLALHFLLRLGEIRTVQKIPQQRMSNMTHMDPDLMGTSSLQPQPDKRISLPKAFKKKVGYRLFSLLKIHASFDGRPLLSGNGSIDRAGVGKTPCGNGQIFPVNLMLHGHSG